MHNSSKTSHASLRAAAMQSQRGLSLVELMVSMALGLILLAALVALFVNTSSARRELDRSADLQESGRYALDFMREELMHAGFYGPLTSVSGIVDEPCSTDVTKWRNSLSIHVRGSNQDDASGLFDCISKLRKPGTDAVFIQRAATCAAGEAGCAPVTPGEPYLQVSLCGDQYRTDPVVAGLATGDPTTTPFTLKDKNCDAAKPAPVRRFLRRIFFVGTDDSLYSVDVNPTGVGTPMLATAGVDNLQFEYALDTDTDGSPDSYMSAPAATDWPNVIGVRMWVLSRATESSPRTEGKTFNLGDAQVVTQASDRFKRHVFSTFTTFSTPQGLRE